MAIKSRAARIDSVSDLDKGAQLDMVAISDIGKLSLCLPGVLSNALRYV